MTADTILAHGIRPGVASLYEDAIAVRRDVHYHAELSGEERRTQELILNWLNRIGAEDVRAIADTGVTAIVRGAKPGPDLLWRADIDALPLIEQTGLPFASTNGAMHACGHDGHIAIALVMASLLQQSRDSFAGSVRFAFQPAEEHIGGAQRMIDDGVLDHPKVERLFGLHLWASNPVGDVLVREGAIFASATHFRIMIFGRGGHAAAPHQTADPIVVAAQAVTALQTIVSRSIDPEETAVLTIGRIQGGVRGNIIPEEVMMSGTVRTYNPRVLDRVLRRMDELLAGVTAAFGATYSLDHSTLGACVNDPGSAALVTREASALVGADRVRETRATGADDMCKFLEAVPGAYFLLGAAPAGVAHVHPHHHPKFDFDEAAIPLGAELGLRVLEAASAAKLT